MLHLANGTIYLPDFCNIDIETPDAHLAINRPDLVKVNKTTLENYYKDDVQRDDFMSGRLQHKEVVCDMFADIRELPFRPRSVSGILAVQVFEHFSFQEGKDLLKYWYKLLKKGAVLHLDVPDLEGTVELYKDDPKWATRLLYGSQKNEYGIHKAMYNKDTLRELLEEIGFKRIRYLPNIHNYPGFGITGIKVE